MNTEIGKKDYYFFLFQLGVWWRIIYALLKFILGLALLNFINKDFAGLFYELMSHELIEDPDDILIQTIGLFLSKNNGYITYFVASYFIFWGIIDMFLFVNLLRKKIRAYPIAIFLINVFIIYGAYRFTHTHSKMLLAILILDIFIVWAINKEYKKMTSPESKVISL